MDRSECAVPGHRRRRGDRGGSARSPAGRAALRIRQYRLGADVGRGVSPSAGARGGGRTRRCGGGGRRHAAARAPRSAPRGSLDCRHRRRIFGGRGLLRPRQRRRHAGGQPAADGGRARRGNARAVARAGAGQPRCDPDSGGRRSARVNRAAGDDRHRRLSNCRRCRRRGRAGRWNRHRVPQRILGNRDRGRAGAGGGAVRRRRSRRGIPCRRGARRHCGDLVDQPAFSSEEPTAGLTAPGSSIRACRWSSYRSARARTYCVAGSTRGSYSHGVGSPRASPREACCRSR
jgi:hypothetical protein